jgi:hypothetical protein
MVGKYTTVILEGIIIYAEIEDDRIALVNVINHLADIFTNKVGCA